MWIMVEFGVLLCEFELKKIVDECCVKLVVVEGVVDCKVVMVVLVKVEM